MRRKGIFMALLMIVLGISAYMAIQQNRDEDKDIAAILNHQAQIDKIVVMQDDKTLATFNGKGVARYAEPTPLVNIAEAKRKTTKKFEKDAAYTVQYFYDNKLLYTVAIFALKNNESLTTEEKSFVATVNDQTYLVVWQPYDKQLSQHEHTVELLKKIQTN